MKHAVVTNIPKNPKEIFDLALKKSYEFWIDEKGTKKHPSVWRRQPSDLTYDEAFDIIQNHKPHWVISFRNQSYISSEFKNYWEFGGSNIGHADYGEVFIWIKVEIEEAEKIFDKFKLNIEKY